VVKIGQICAKYGKSWEYPYRKNSLAAMVYCSTAAIQQEQVAAVLPQHIAAILPQYKIYHAN
jgi:hypothetical protein